MGCVVFLNMLMIGLETDGVNWPIWNLSEVLFVLFYCTFESNKKSEEKGERGRGLLINPRVPTVGRYGISDIKFLLGGEVLSSQNDLILKELVKTTWMLAIHDCLILIC